MKGFYKMFRTKEEFENCVYAVAEQLLIGKHIQEEFKAQMCCDAWTIALHQEHGFGPGEFRKLQPEINDIVHEICTMTVDDAKGDPNFIYTKAKIDDAIREAVGEEDFQPWEKRYSQLYTLPQQMMDGK